MRKINLILIVFCLIFTHAFSQPMSGTYTIGGVYSDYNSFNEAITALTINGVSGAIVFDIEAGNYNEQLTIPKITGASLTNTITFQSITADSSDVVLSYASTNENLNYTVKFDTCCYINFKKITLSSQGTRSYNNLIEINNAYNLGFYNCQLIGHTNNNSYESRLVYSNENINNASNIKIKNCNINYGYYGIVLNGKSPSEQSDKLEISGNVFRNQYREVITVKKYKNSEISNNSIFGELSYNGLYFKNCLSIDILNNLIKADAHTGIGLFENNNQFNIKNNVIYNFRTYGIHVVHSSDIVSAKPRISNNFISGKGIGIYIFYSPYYEIYHNSINSDGLCMDIESSNVLMKNNILHNKNNGSCINISSSSNDVVLDYNNLYATGAIFGTWKGVNCANLSEWQTNSSQAANSISYKPDYISDSDLHTYSVHLNNAGLGGLETSDIDGELRNATSPDIGADEYDPFTLDLKIIDFIVPTSCSLTTTEDITITIVNTGTSSQNNFSVQYSIDSGASFVNEVISPTIQSGDSLVYTFVNKADFSQLGKYNCIAVVHAIGDENTENDTSITSTISYPNIDTFPFIEKFELGDNLSFVEQSGEQAKILVNNQSANNSEFGLNFFGGDYNSGWQGGSNPDSINIWVQNTKFQASAYSCDIDVSSLLNPILQFDIRLMSQDYSNNSWFRVLINNIVQIKDINGDHTYNNNMTDFETKQFDLSAYAGNNFTLKFQSCCRIGSQDMVYIDNIVIGEPPIVNLGNDTAICENDTITLDAGAGVGYSYYWRKLPSPDIIGLNQHINITDAGTYHVDVYSDAGIISSDTIILIVNPSYYFVEQEFICNTDSLLWQGDYYLSEGTYYANYQTVNDCDSVYELNLTVNPKYFYTEQQTICDNGSLFWHGNYYDIPGTYYDSLSTVMGCDSIYEMQLIVNPTFFYTEQQTICDNDSILWHGNYYDIPGTYYDSLSTVMGCDSIYEMQLVVNPIFFYTEQYTICENDSLLWRGNYYDTSGTYCDSLNTVMGCDSVYEMQLVVNPTFFYSEQQTICNNDSLFWHQSYYNIQGTYYDSLQTVLGCDSIFELQLFVNPAFYFEDIMTTCNGNSVEWRGNYYSVSGIYYDSLQTTVGCDSVYALNLIITPNYYYSDVLNICEDSVLWHGDYYFTSGVYTDSLLTIAGCDSIFEVQINFNNSYYMVEYDSVCDDNYIYWHDMIINSTGVYYDNLETVQGCDSIFELNFTRNVSSFTEENISICENEQYFWHGIDYSTQGVYYDTLQATTGCDSIFKLSLQINPLPYTPEIWGPDTVNIGDTTLYWLPPYDLLDSWLVDNCIIVEYLDDFHIKVKWDTIGIAYVYASFKNHHECTDTTYKQIIVEDGSGIGFINTSNINVYPNPTSGLITIEGQNIDLVEIVNVDGQIVKQCSENRRIYIMNLSGFSKGLYLIKITTSKGIINRKIVLE